MRNVLAVALLGIVVPSPGASSLVAAADSAASGKESRPGVYRGYSEQLYSESVSTSQYVAVRDGTKLAVDIYRPARNGQAVAGRFPVIWVHTPYRRAYLRPDGKKVSQLDSWGLIELVKYGYVLAAVDTRGRGASFGARRGFQDRTEAQDAYDMTEWFAAQPWSTGDIGVVGCSYMGGSTFHVATVAPPHLRAIAPGCTDFDKYGFVSRGGITAQFNTRPENPEQDFGQGVLPVDEDKEGTLAAEAIAGHKAGTPMAELWAGMPFRDDVSPLLHVPFWKEVSPMTYTDVIEKSGVGIFIWGNWLDEGSFEATLAFNNLRNPRKLWMGGFGHCQIGQFPMAVEFRRFFDRYLKHIDNGWDREPPIYYYTVNAAPGSEWASARRWPLPESHHEALSLSGSAMPGRAGALSFAPARSTSPLADHFVVNYTPVCRGKVDLYFIFWPCEIENHGLGYTTQPLSADVHVAGHPIADLWIASSAADADLFVYLERITAAGEISIVTHGRLRASLRSEQKPPFRDFMGVPYHRANRSDARPLVPGEPTRVRLDLLPTSTIFKAGDRLRLTIAGADPRQRSRTVRFDPPPTLSVFHDAAHGSRLFLPVLAKPQFESGNAATATGPVPNSAESQPYGAANAQGAPSAQDLSTIGYTEEEFFVSGRASEYRYDKDFNVIAGPADIPYTTRLLIRRPGDPQRFSGIVHLENAHPLAGGHGMWSAAGRYMTSHGDAYALLMSGEDALTRGGAIAPERAAMRAQLQGQQDLGIVHVLQRFDPKRYAPLVWPDTDAARWDAMAQTGAFLKSRDPHGPMAGFAVKRIYAEGWSFTGSLLRTFINEGFHDRARLADGRPIFDGYLIGISSSTFVSGVISLTTGTPTLPIGHPRRVTRAIDVPVIELMTENEAVTNTGPQAADIDTGFGRHRLYEVGGLTHGDGLAPPGRETTMRYQLQQRGLPARTDTDACSMEHSDVPMGHLAGAALANLDAWVTRGVPPPHAERLQLDPATHAVIRDEFGNARGGVRTAQLDVPLATYAEPGAGSPESCRGPAGPFMRIRRLPFDRAKVLSTYGSEAQFMQRFASRAHELVKQRWLLEDDARLEIEAARTRVAQALESQ